MFNGAREIGDEIYLYKNFISQEEAVKYVKIAESIPDEDWQVVHKDRPHNSHAGNSNLSIILNKISSIFPENLSVKGENAFTKMTVGGMLQEHFDECIHCTSKKNVHDNNQNRILEYKKNHLINTESKPSKPFENHCLKYGMVIYFSQFTGGEIYYPKQNIIVTPEPGDLVIHSSKPECMHGVKPVISGTRYTMAPYVIEILKEE